MMSLMEADFNTQNKKNLLVKTILIIVKNIIINVLVKYKDCLPLISIRNFVSIL